MSQATADDIKKHGSISAGYLSKLLATLPPDTPITSMGMAFSQGLPNMDGSFGLCFYDKFIMKAEAE